MSVAKSLIPPPVQKLMARTTSLLCGRCHLRRQRTTACSPACVAQETLCEPVRFGWLGFGVWGGLPVGLGATVIAVEVLQNRSAVHTRGKGLLRCCSRSKTLRRTSVRGVRLRLSFDVSSRDGDAALVSLGRRFGRLRVRGMPEREAPLSAIYAPSTKTVSVSGCTNSP